MPKNDAIASKRCVVCRRKSKVHLKWCSECWKRVSDRSRSRGSRQNGDRIKPIHVEHVHTRDVLAALDSLQDAEVPVDRYFVRRKSGGGNIPLDAVEPLLAAVATLTNLLAPAVAESRESIEVDEEIRRNARL